MKKLNLLKHRGLAMCLLTLCTLLLGVGNVWGETEIVLADITPSNYWYEVSGVGRVANKTGNGAFSSADYAKGDATCSNVGYKTGSSNFTVQPYIAISGIRVMAASTSNRALNAVTVAATATTASTSNSVTYTETKTGSYAVNKNSCDNEFTVTFESTVEANKYVNFLLSGNADIIAVELIPAGGDPEPAEPVCPSGLTIASKGNKTAFTEGDKIELTSSLSAGNGEISYQWYKGGVAIDGATSKDLTINSCVLADAGSYTCKATKTDCEDVTSTNSLVITIAETPKANFSLTVTNGYTENVNSKATHDITAEEATISGGTAQLYNGKSSATALMTATQIALGGSSGSYLKITFADGAKMLPGCVITIDTKNTFKLTATNSSSNALNTTAETGAYTVTAEDILNGSNTLYVWKNGGSTFTKIKVSTPVYKTVTFVAGDAEATGSMDAVDVEVGEEYAIPTCAFEVAGKDFNGWTTSDVTITDGKFTMPNNNVTLTANWVAAATKYHVTYTAGTTDPITGDLPTQADLAAGSTFNLAALNIIAREGYTQSHWYDGANYYFGGVEYTMPDHDVELVAYWKQTVNVTLDKNGATADGSAVAVVGSGELLNKNVVAHATAPAGWTLDGYYTAAEGGDLVITKDGKLAQAAVDGWLSYSDKANWTRTEAGTLYAHWTINYAQDVDFEAAATAGTPSPQDVLTANGYSYTGGATTWDNNTSSNNGSYLGLKMKEANSTVEFLAPAAKMVVLKVGILVNNKSEMYQNDVKVAENMVGGSKNSGDNFKLYYFYSDEAASYRFKTTAADAQIIKAISFVDPYKVTFANGGEIDPMTFKGTALTLPAATGDGEFQGWFDAETAGTKIGDEGDLYTPTADITLYAQFSTQSTNNEIASFTYGETNVVATEGKREYAIELPYKSEIPAEITVTKAEEHATVSEIAKDGGVFTFSVTSESNAVANYTVTFTIAPKDGVCITKTETTGSKNQTITGVYGDTEAANMVNVASDKKLGGKGQWIGVALVAGQTFAEGDIINIHTTTAGQQGNIAIYSNTGASATKIADLDSGFGVLGDNKYTLPASVEAYSKLYIARTDANNWNGYVDYVEVSRIVNPTMTSFKVGETMLTIDEANKTVTGEVTCDLTSITPTIEFVTNDNAHATITPAGAQNFTNAVTYTITDKDGDATDYTVTLTRATYSREVTNALGSICLPYAVTSTKNSNATFYKVVGKRVNTNGDPTSIVLLEVEELEAGMPYIFEAEDTTEPVVLALSGNAAAEAGNAKGVYGTFAQLTIDYTPREDTPAFYWYAVSNNTFKAMNTGSKVSANRAYLKMEDVPEYEEPTTPGAPVRIITLVDEANTATGIDTLAGSATDSQKFMKDGQLFILRNGVLYNAIGQVVK